MSAGTLAGERRDENSVYNSKTYPNQQFKKLLHCVSDWISRGGGKFREVISASYQPPRTVKYEKDRFRVFAGVPVSTIFEFLNRLDFLS
jgi:hypothetical protein